MIEVWADSCGHGCDLTALWRARSWPNRELSHSTYRSVDEAGRVHRAGARWGEARAVVDVRLRWHPDCEPRAVSVRLEGVEGAYTGVVVEQSLGSERHPGLMRLEALAVDFGDPVPLAVWIDDVRYVPAMPPPMDLSDIHALELLAPEGPGYAVLTALQIGGNGEHLPAWWRAVAPDGWAEPDFGAVFGRVRLVVPVDGPRRLVTPHPCPFALESVEFQARRDRPQILQGPHPKGSIGHGPGVLREGWQPRHAKGLFGGVGVAPDGRREVKPGPGAPHFGSHALCLHVADGRTLLADGWWPLAHDVPVPPEMPEPPSLAPCAATLPDGWDALARALVDDGRLFFGDDGRVFYGAWPSVYWGDVFGLEEDYLLRGLAFWGLPDLALDGLRTTYLTDAHLDRRHYLRDLRHGLTPWQTEWLLRLSGGALTAAERARVEACGDWIEAERARVVPGDRFPDLLPTFRFGGDLDHPAQAVYTDALCCVGLAALGRDTDDYRRAIDAALAALDGDRPELHAGPDDPGDYYQLMAAGILLPVGYFAPDDPRVARLAATLEREDRLVSGLPRFDGWGPPPCIDAHYALGYLQHLLEVGRRDDFWRGLCALRDLAMDPDTRTFREVSPAAEPPAWAEARVPARRLGQAEPCVGGPGVVLMLLRQALVHELRGAEGRPTGEVRVFGGVPEAWLSQTLEFGPAPTWSTPVTIRLHAGTLEIDSPGGVLALPTGDVPLAPGPQRIRLG